MRIAIVAALVMVSGGAWASGATCSGALERMQGGFQVGGCNLIGASARRVLQSCSPGQQCVVTGTLEHCRGVRGACVELTRVTDAHFGNPLPACQDDAAVIRADQWWIEGGSVVVQGTIATRSQAENGSAPYGHTKIVMDMVNCSNWSSLPLDRVADQWIGHYVQVHGTAMKGQDGWYIIANDVKSAN